MSCKDCVGMRTSALKVGLHKEPALYNGHFDDISKAKVYVR